MNESLVTVVAHRGIHDEHPENSLEAFLEAWRAGVEWCECDVRGSLEHEPFILHDETLERTTDGGGKISQTSSAVLKRLHLHRADGALSPSILPSLADLISAMASGAKLLIEIKPKVTQEVIARTLEQCDEVSCIVQSFDREVVIQASRIRPSIRRFLLVDDPVRDRAMKPGPWEGINARHDKLLSEHVEQLREMKLWVGVWTPNEPADIRRAIGLHVDAITSDQPLRVVELLRALLTLKGI